MSIPSTVNNAFSHLSAPSNSVVLEALVVIRKFISKNEHVKVVREKNVFKELVDILGKPNERNLDMTLSILGNCCLEKESRDELFKLGIVRAVVTVFNSTCRDTIQGRACRVIGNLALEHDIAVKLHKENVINTLVNIVDCEGSYSIASQQMAVRALRILWSVESERISMLEHNVVRKVALLLTTQHEKTEEKEFLKTVVKALTVFTHRCSEQCAFQVHADGSVLQNLLSLCCKTETKSSVIMCVYNLCHNGSARPMLGTAGVVKVILNELSLCNSQFAEPTETQNALISSLCLLCRESVNRAKIRRAGGLPIILSVLQDCKKSSLQSSALHALVLFIYDEMSLQELLKEGLVLVLVKKLQIFVEKHGQEHEQECLEEMKNDQCSPKKRQISSIMCGSTMKNKADEDSSGYCKTQEGNQVLEAGTNNENWKRFRVSSPNYQAVVQEYGLRRTVSCASPSHSGDNFGTNFFEQSDSYQMGDWSPGSPRSMGFSPESSPSYGRQWNYSPASIQMSPFSPCDGWSSPSSPMSHCSMEMECDFPEVYSPVCHDAPSEDEEDSEEEKHECPESCPLEEEPQVALKTVEESPNTNWEKMSEVSNSDVQRSVGEDSDILILMSRISHMDTLVEDLVMKSSLTTLLNYMRLLQNPIPRAGRILGRIVRSHHYFIHLICHHFVLNIYMSFCQPLHSHCVTCDKLMAIGNNLISKVSIIAESGFGKGELSHNLLKAEYPTKEIIAVTVPFIIKTPKILKTLLLDCKGLEILQNIVETYSRNLGHIWDYIPVCLSLLASSLKISSPVNRSDIEKYRFSPSEIKPTLSKDAPDNIKFVLDNGEIVSASRTFLSEQSSFFEAMLRGSFKESNEECISLREISSDVFTILLNILQVGKVCSLPTLTLPTALELLVVLDRFLLPGSQELSELIINQFLKPSSVFDVYCNLVKYQGVLEVFDLLRLKTVQYILVSEMSVEKRRVTLEACLKGPYSLEIQKDLFDILKEKLNAKF